MVTEQEARTVEKVLLHYEKNQDIALIFRDNFFHIVLRQGRIQTTATLAIAVVQYLHKLPMTV